MKHIVKFSGGAASAVVAKLVIDEFGHDDVILLYSDTKSEHPDADRFRDQVCKFLGHEMTVVADGRDIWELIDDSHTLPGQFMPFCTQLLKQRPSERFLKSLGEDFISYLGF
jgi:3'-phosphoadenosine 5'-phosphosulfate sulfotransferase (PAPS reductase)/FAD synthetase